MSADDNRAIMRRYFAALDRQDLDAAEAMLAPDYAAHPAGSPGAMDATGMRGFAGMFFAAFPDLRHAVEDQVAEGDRVVSRLKIQGTHRGDFQGTAPTGKSVAIDAINISRLAGGKVAEQWIIFDTLGLLQQIGAIPAPEQAREPAAAV